MNRENVQWIAVALIACGLIGVTSIIVKQNEQLNRVSQGLDRVETMVEIYASKAKATPTPTSASSIPTSTLSNSQTIPDVFDGFSVITQKPGITSSGFVIQFVHLCKGTVQAAEGQSVPFCLGENRLGVLNPVSSFSGPEILASNTVSKAEDAPVLMNVEYVKGATKQGGAFLISYTPEPCTTMNDCGAGMPEHYVRYVYDFSNLVGGLRSIQHFPERGTLTWNSLGTKALVYPNSAGGAGYEAVILTGYDLLKDSQKNLTTVTGVGDIHGSASDPHTDIQGKRLPFWNKFDWIDDSHFTAELINPDGTKKIVNGQF